MKRTRRAGLGADVRRARATGRTVPTTDAARFRRARPVRYAPSFIYLGAHTPRDSRHDLRQQPPDLGEYLGLGSGPAEGLEVIGDGEDAEADEDLRMDTACRE